MKKEKGVAVVSPQGTSIEAILSQAIDKGTPVETMERLLAMRRELKAEAAKEAYDRAMAAFQAECPTIEKTKAVKTRDGQLAYKYAPIESIVKQVAPYLQKHGFSYSTGMELKESGVKVTVRTTHELGHSEESSMEVPLGNKTAVMSDTQVTAAAQTFAKRYAFCNAFGILTGDEDNDGAPMGAPQKPRMQSYSVRKDPVIEYEEDYPPAEYEEENNKVLTGKSVKGPKDKTTEVKKSILRRLLELDPLIDPKDRKMIALEVASRTKLDLTEDNFEEIASRLQILVDEMREGQLHHDKEEHRA